MNKNKPFIVVIFIILVLACLPFLNLLFSNHAYFKELTLFKMNPKKEKYEYIITKNKIKQIKNDSIINEKKLDKRSYHFFNKIVKKNKPISEIDYTLIEKGTRKSLYGIEIENNYITVIDIEKINKINKIINYYFKEKEK
ncbi:MAG: hypothetical protein RR659_01860 [Bacilli bacterium]